MPLDDAAAKVIRALVGPGEAGEGAKESLARRELLLSGLTLAGWGGFIATLGVAGIETLRFFFPRVLYQPPTTFRIGAPEEFMRGGTPDAYGVIEVDETWKRRYRFFVVRQQDRIFAMSGRCTHLGCTVNWFASARQFRCPCHGSEYHSNGVNFSGPAPRPLPRLKIGVDLSGMLVVDTSKVFEADSFDHPDSFVLLG